MILLTDKGRTINSRIGSTMTGIRLTAIVITKDDLSDAIETKKLKDYLRFVVHPHMDSATPDFVQVLAESVEAAAQKCQSRLPEQSERP